MRVNVRAFFAGLVLLAVGCSGGNTYVLVQIDKGASTPSGIVEIDLGLQLAGRTASTALHERSGGPIVFPTSTTLEIRNGHGTMMVSAVARDAGGAQVDGASGDVEVVSGKNATLRLMLGAAVVTDDLAGADGLPGSDGAADLSTDDRGSVPGAPTGVVASSGNASATVSWNAPASDGGSPITGYTVTSSPDNISVAVGAGALMANVTGLANGTSYTFTVVATNAIGNGPASAPSNAVTPLAVPQVPSAPAMPTASVGGARTAVVAWSGANNNGSAIVSYTVVASPGGAMVTTANGTTLSAMVGGLTAGTAYTFTVAARNGVGLGPASAASNPLTAVDVPNAPTGTPTATAVAGNAVHVTWTAATTNGSPVTSYTVTSSPGGFTATTADGSTLAATVSGLSNGTPYTFTVKANSAVGASTASNPSGSVTAADVPSAPTSPSATAVKGYQASVTWSASATHSTAVTSYTVTSTPGGLTSTTPNGVTLTATVTGLSSGQSYTFSVVANSALGASGAAATSSITAGDVPTQPGTPTAAAGNLSANVSWSASTANGVPITSYTVTSSPGGLTSTTPDGSTTSTTVGGLSNGQSYTFTVVANSSLGASTASSASSPPMVAGAAPSAPTLSAACGANGGVWLTYTTSGNTTSVNAYYRTTPGVTPQNGTKAAGISELVSGLSNGQIEYFVLTGVNAFGESAPSGEASAIPSALPHDMMILSSGTTVEFWDCFSQIANGTTQGTRTFTSNLLSGPAQMLVDGNGALYISDSPNNAVYVWNDVSTLSGANPPIAKSLVPGPTPGNGPVNPTGMVIFGSNLLVANSDQAVRIYPLNWTDSTTAPSVTISNVASGISQMTTSTSGTSTELWVAEGNNLAGFQGIESWTTDQKATRTVTLTLSSTGRSYTGVSADAASDVIYFATWRSGGGSQSQIDWPTQSGFTLTGTKTLSTWNNTTGVGTGSMPTYQTVFAGGQLFLVYESAIPGSIGIWTNAANAHNNPADKTMTSNYTGGAFTFVP
jgi:hypothetical protein